MSSGFSQGGHSPVRSSQRTQTQRPGPEQHPHKLLLAFKASIQSQMDLLWVGVTQVLSEKIRTLK